MFGFWELILAVLGALGGIAVIAGGAGALFGKYFADRSLEKHKSALGQETERLKGELGKDLETHKWKLKRNEIIFEKQLAAAGEFFDLHRKLRPTYNHPDMDWDEARQNVLENFGSSADDIEKFVAKHGPILGDDNRKLLDSCRDLASNNRFAAQQGNFDPQAMDAAEEFLGGLQKIEREFLKVIRE